MHGRNSCVRARCPAGQQRNHADDELVVAQMREQLQARMRSLGSLQPPAEATACLEVSGHGSLCVFASCFSTAAVFVDS